MYSIKEKPEDFVVEELTETTPKPQGSFLFCRLQKRNYTTVRAIQHLADRLHIRPRQIGFAGTKDKNAVTTQYITIQGASKHAIEKVDLADVSVEFLGYVEGSLYLGNLKGNQFDIVVRNINEQPKKVIKFYNYFGEQRFSQNNEEIGLLLLKKEFKKAAELIGGRKGDYEADVRVALEKEPTNYVGALRTIPKSIIHMFINAYQSIVFNKVVELLETEDYDADVEIPLVGFGTELGDDKVSKKIQEILQEDNLTTRDFIVREIPSLSSEGGSRPLQCTIEDLSFGDLEDDDLHEGKKKIHVRFWLRKGSYATVALRYLFS